MIWLIMSSLINFSSGDDYVMGYLTGSQRKEGDLVYPRPGLRISGAISYAVDEVNRDFEARGLDTRLSFVVAETYGDEEISIDQTARLWRANVSAFIGPQETCVHEGRMATSFNLPMISYFCADQATSDKKYFRTFARTRPPATQISKSLAALLLSYEWTKIIFMHLDSENGIYRKVANTIKETLLLSNVTVLDTKSWYTPYQFPYSENPFHDIVLQTYQNGRIYVILGSNDEHLGLLTAMEGRHLLTGGEYFVVGVELEQYDKDDPGRYMRGLLRNDVDPLVVDAFGGYFGIKPTPPMDIEHFSMKVNEYMEKPPFNFSNPLIQLGISRVIPAEACYLYDAVYLYANALSQVLEKGGNALNGTDIIQSLKGTRYKSAMGYMGYIDENGDAEGNYTLLAIKPNSDIPERFGLYPVGTFIRDKNSSKLPKLYLLENLTFVPPAAEPECGFTGEKCVTPTRQIVGIFMGFILILFFIASLVFYRNWKYEQELDSLLWKVDFKDIQFNEEDMANTLGTRITRASHPLIRTSQVSLSSNTDIDFRYSAIYTTICIYKGRIYALEKVKKKSIDLNRSMKKELKMLRDLRHENINLFIGACTEAPNICIITEYCARGSLRDILENDDVKLDNMFLASLVGDIIRGMIYLHDSPIKVHGKLKSSNCLVDSRWVLKLSDIGLREFKKDAEKSGNTNKELEGLLYRSPELLRMENSEDFGTQKGDVYSFAIILHELHSRKGPFGETGYNHLQIINKVINYDPLRGPFRPSLEDLENNFDFIRICLKECWAEEPESRPDFKTIRTRLRPMRKGMKANIFDNMMAMMEKYANNLEALVDDRTDQLVEEKKKTEALLYEMLPRYVADQLKRGNKVEAENFDSVTIYFSDIVGFTAMSAESTPLQVVDFLNDLYTCFDSTIEHYDVYKVETIGDAYMVVSGLPIRNGDSHAGEIATMSLHLLEAVKKFRIKHRPAESVKLRIGIHSGPVCAGVVGLKMPRYCLFGDTVNTASRMESTGSPGHIHCSAETKTLLDKLGGYILSERGIVAMKGKGNQFTYWLEGESAENKQRRERLREEKGASMNSAKARQPRSSLKTRQPKTNIPRCSSFECPKKLRFASTDNHASINSSAQLVVDASPKILTLLSVPDATEEHPVSSTSCPCIRNLPTGSSLSPASPFLLLPGYNGSSGSNNCKNTAATIPSNINNYNYNNNNYVSVSVPALLEDCENSDENFKVLFRVASDSQNPSAILSFSDITDANVSDPLLTLDS